MILKNLSKSYDGKFVVTDVNLSLPENKVISFIGPNGAGKSTVLNMISRLHKKDSGQIIFKGKELENWDNNELAKNLAILTQHNNIQSKITIKELVSFGRFPYCQGRLKDEDEQKVIQALEYMELLDIQHKYLDELSGGQRQRALIAMTIAQDTDYILLDEPTNNLDIYHSSRLMKLIRSLCDKLNKTVIMVLHELNYASFYSDIICVFKQGRLEKVGSPTEIIQHDFLKEVYQVDFNISHIDGKPLCIHF